MAVSLLDQVCKPIKRPTSATTLVGLPTFFAKAAQLIHPRCGEPPPVLPHFPTCKTVRDDEISSA